MPTFFPQLFVIALTVACAAVAQSQTMPNSLLSSEGGPLPNSPSKLDIKFDAEEHLPDMQLVISVRGDHLVLSNGRACTASDIEAWLQTSTPTNTYILIVPPDALASDIAKVVKAFETGVVKTKIKATVTLNIVIKV